MDVEKLIDDREKDIHEVYDILLGWWEGIVVVLEQSVQAITEEKTKQNENQKENLKILHVKYITEGRVSCYLNVVLFIVKRLLFLSEDLC